MSFYRQNPRGQGLRSNTLDPVVGAPEGEPPIFE